MSTNTYEVKDLMAALGQKRTELKEAVQAFDARVEIDGANVSLDKKSLDACRKVQAEIKEITEVLELKQFGADIDSLIARGGSSVAVAAAALSGARGPLQGKSLGRAFTESGEFKSLTESGGYEMRKPFEIPVGDVVGYAQKDLYTGMADAHNIDMSVGTVVQNDPMVPRGQLRNRVRDLFPVATTSANLITYIRTEGFVENDGDGNAQSVKDWDPTANSGQGGFGTKPKSNLKFSAEKAPVETIAHYEMAHRNILDDVPQLETTINNELMYGLKLEEDDQILNGDGANNHLLGILQTDGVQDYNRVTGDSYADALRRAATKCVLAYFPATAYVLHPNDWETTELTKATGDGQYVLVSNVAIGAQTQVWRLPVVETPAMNEGEFLTGAFGLGAQLYDRQQANIRIAEQHANTFVQNAITILCEERLALAVKRPESFVHGKFATA